jgi:hypothetical protein
VLGLAAGERRKILDGRYDDIVLTPDERAVLQSMEQQGEAKPRDKAAVAIIELCNAAGKPALAAEYIAAGMTVAESRAALAVEGWSTALTAAQQCP